MENNKYSKIVYFFVSQKLCIYTLIKLKPFLIECIHVFISLLIEQRKSNCCIILNYANTLITSLPSSKTTNPLPAGHMRPLTRNFTYTKTWFIVIWYNFLHFRKCFRLWKQLISKHFYTFSSKNQITYNI